MLIPVGATVKLNKSGKLVVYINALFLSFRIYPSKKTNKNKSEKSNKTNQKAAKENIIKSSKGIINTISEFSEIIKLLLNKIPYIVKKCIIKKLKIEVIIGSNDDSSDAALVYGAICAITYPLVGILHHKLRFNHCAERVKIECNFNQEKTTVDLNFKFTILVFHLVRVGLHVLRSFIKIDYDEEIG